MNQILSLIIVLLTAGTALAKDWRGIVPLHSTRTDVERLLGPPTMDRSDTVVYDYAGERASIEFSRGPCTVEFSPWNVPRDIVINIWVTPKLNELRIADLSIDQRKFKKILDEHRPQIAYYRNEEDGIEYSVDDESGKVGLVKYFPSASDHRFRCPEPPNRLSETIRFAQYSNISFAAERKILDRFAQQIIRYTPINYASAQAYILAYRGKAKPFLIRHPAPIVPKSIWSRGIKSIRIVSKLLMQDTARSRPSNCTWYLQAATLLFWVPLFLESEYPV